MIRGTWRPLWWCAALALLLSLSGCAAQASAGLSGQASATVPVTTPTAGLPSTSPYSSSTPEATPTNVVIAGTPGAYGPTCLPNQLTLVVEPLGAAMGNVGQMAHFTNHSATACSLYGFPGAQMLDAQHDPVTTHTHWQTSAYMYTTQPVQHVELAPGASAYFEVEWVDEGGAQTVCSMASYLEVTPPNDYSALTVPDSISACGGDLYLSPVEPTQFIGG